MCSRPVMAMIVKFCQTATLQCYCVALLASDRYQSKAGQACKKRYSCLYLGKVACQESAKLDQCIVALVKELANQLQVIVLSLLVDDTIALLRHEEDEGHSQSTLDQAILQPL